MVEQLLNYATIGAREDHRSLVIVRRLMQLGINNEWAFNSTGSYYYYDGEQIRRTDKHSAVGEQIFRERQIITPEEFLEVLNNIAIPKGPDYGDWYKDLKEGDIVTIAKRDAPSAFYPYGFPEEMAVLAGKEFVIRAIRENYIDAGFAQRPKFNGDCRKYFLKDSPYGWHSSMFVPTVLDPSMKLEIVDIPLLKLL